MTDDSLRNELRAVILDRLNRAGAAGLTTTGLKLPKSGSRKGRVARDVLRLLIKDGDVGNLGSPRRPRYVTREHFRPLELAHAHLEARARERGVRLGSKTMLSRGLGGAILNNVDEALKLLVAEGTLVRLSWSGRPVYVHAGALPHGDAVAPPAEPAGVAPAVMDEAAIRRAYRETVREFGYPDVLIHEVFRRTGGELASFKAGLLEACRTGRAVPGVGDWSLSPSEAREAALYINGQPHLRVRFRE
jgi:hypothetical protein